MTPTILHPAVGDVRRLHRLVAHATVGIRPGGGGGTWLGGWTRGRGDAGRRPDGRGEIIHSNRRNQFGVGRQITALLSDKRCTFGWIVVNFPSHRCHPTAAAAALVRRRLLHCRCQCLRFHRRCCHPRCTHTPVARWSNLQSRQRLLLRISGAM